MARDVRPDPAARGGVDVGALAPALPGIVAAARAAWPSVEVAPERFAAYLRERVPAGRSLDSVHTSDLYLACACVDGDARALAAFDRECLAVADRALPRLGLDGDAVNEVKQRLRRLLLVAETGPPRIAAFAGRGDLRNWIRITAVREALALERHDRRCTAVDDDQLAELVAAGAPPELAYLKRIYRRELAIALAEAVRALSDRERAVLKLHFLDRVTVQQIGRLYRVHRVTVARWLECARATLLAATRAYMQQRLRIQPDELDSILRLVLSRLDISLRPLFRR